MLRPAAGGGLFRHRCFRRDRSHEETEMISLTLLSRKSFKLGATACGGLATMGQIKQVAEDFSGTELSKEIS